VVRSYGLGVLPRIFNLTPGRREVERLTGNRMVPTLVLDDGTVIDGSQKIIDWAVANPV
jgi:glutathione S-transferase